jgi:hypothetical protein
MWAHWLSSYYIQDPLRIRTTYFRIRRSVRCNHC